jgi:hypothetical protein
VDSTQPQKTANVALLMLPQFIMNDFRETPAARARRKFHEPRVWIIDSEGAGLIQRGSLAGMEEHCLDGSPFVPTS